MVRATDIYAQARACQVFASLVCVVYTKRRDLACNNNKTLKLERQYIYVHQSSTKNRQCTNLNHHHRSSRSLNYLIGVANLDLAMRARARFTSLKSLFGSKFVYMCAARRELYSFFDLTAQHTHYSNCILNLLFFII